MKKISDSDNITGLGCFVCIGSMSSRLVFYIARTRVLLSGTNGRRGKSPWNEGVYRHR